MVDNMGDRVMLLEKTVFSKKEKRSSPFSLSPVMLLAINIDSLAGVPQNLLSFFTAPTGKKIWETLLYTLFFARNANKL